MEITRRFDGKYTVSVRVSSDESERRAAVAQKLRAEKAEALKTAAPPPAPIGVSALQVFQNSLDAMVKKARAAAPSNRQDGLWDAPGAPVARDRMEMTPACFQVGETVRYWSPWIDDENDGREMTITREFALHEINDNDGPFVTESGNRVTYRWGYVAQTLGGVETFYPAYNVQSNEFRRHLVLVK